MTPDGSGPSRQVQRAEARAARERAEREEVNHLPPAQWWDVAYTVGLLAISVGLWLVAVASDEVALRAVTNPGWYCWLALCAISTVGVVLTFFARRRGLSVPFYFRVVLWVGATCGVLTFSAAWSVITEIKAQEQKPPPGAHLDIRSQTIRDASFAERNLRGSDFNSATLDRVDLSGADLSESDLRDAVFHKVDLSATNLCGADLRGADLRGARGVEAVKDWSYVFYNNRTKLPRSVSYILFTFPGPIPDNGHDLLYMCKANTVRRLRG